jgi:hypothetical protein
VVLEPILSGHDIRVNNPIFGPPKKKSGTFKKVLDTSIDLILYNVCYIIKNITISGRCGKQKTIRPCLDASTREKPGKERGRRLHYGGLFGKTQNIDYTPCLEPRYPARPEFGGPETGL